jgi:sec-independent protein translocase protein TatB
VFDIGVGELLVLVVAALFIFGPDRLPSVAAQAVRTLRALREMAGSARADLNDAIGPELRELDFRKDLAALQNLDPKTAVTRFLDADDAATPGAAKPAAAAGPAAGATPPAGPGAAPAPLPTGYDPDTT